MGKIRAFSFRYGDSTGKMEWYQVEDDDRAICVKINRYDKEESGYNYEVAEAFLSQLDGVIQDAGILDWNGFYDLTNTMCSGDAWVLHLYYQDGQEVHAMGHTAHPEGFEKGKAALDTFFGDLLVNGTIVT